MKTRQKTGLNIRIRETNPKTPTSAVAAIGTSSPSNTVGLSLSIDRAEPKRNIASSRRYAYQAISVSRGIAMTLLSMSILYCGSVLIVNESKPDYARSLLCTAHYRVT